MPEAYFQLGVDIDTRLLDLWQQVLGTEQFVPEIADEDVRAVLGAAVRTAYAKGYGDALTEDREGRRASLHKANGYRPL